MTQPVCQGLAGARPGCGRRVPPPRCFCRKRRKHRAWAGQSVGCERLRGGRWRADHRRGASPLIQPFGPPSPRGGEGDRAMWAAAVPWPAVGNHVRTSVAAASPVCGSLHRAARASVSRRRTRRRTRPSAGHRGCRCRVAAKGVAGRHRPAEGARGRCRSGGSGAGGTNGAGRTPQAPPAGRAFRVRAYIFRCPEGLGFAMRS